MGAFQVGHDAFEQAASGGTGDPFGGAGFNNPFDDFFNGGGGVNDVCTHICVFLLHSLMVFISNLDMLGKWFLNFLSLLKLL